MASMYGLDDVCVSSLYQAFLTTEGLTLVMKEASMLDYLTRSNIEEIPKSIKTGLYSVEIYYNGGYIAPSEFIQEEDELFPTSLTITGEGCRSFLGMGRKREHITQIPDIISENNKLKKKYRRG